MTTPTGRATAPTRGFRSGSPARTRGACGPRRCYSSASLFERIYAGRDGDRRTGILIYTAVPDAEGTLGGLVALAEPEKFSRVVRRALHDAERCFSDPLCADRLPRPPHEDFLHGAACHVCLFVSETL
ncbi:DUF1998 domain-containing protein [Streptomyces lavendulae]|uniref:DUF1998 domain-containing protein n=1 Tax=Streptomyces lavendulae TaxID=1914 RepID=UPI00340FF7F8